MKARGARRATESNGRRGDRAQSGAQSGVQGGARKRQRPRNFGAALGWTVTAALLPAVLLAAVAWGYVRPRTRQFIGMVLDPTDLAIFLGALVLGWLLWVLLIAVTWSWRRPRPLAGGLRAVGILTALALCVGVTVPLAHGARLVMAQRDLITTVFDDQPSATTPTVTKQNPWGKRKRVNLLLLGGDGGIDREGVRTDSVILVSISTRTGKAIAFSLPRNLRDVPFPEGSPLARIYPNGFDLSGSDAGESMLNAIYRNVPALHPGILGPSANEGADALKQAVSGALGLKVDYYMLVNLSGFEQIVDAIGGITVNINEPVAIGGNKDRNIPPDSYLQPGPEQRLNGFKALWFTRGRWGSTDYKRMARQRCALKAIVDEADPVTLLRRYTDLAAASKKILRTDIPSKLLPALVDLALDMKAQPLKSVVFELSRTFNPNDPDFDFVHDAVQRAIRSERRPSSPSGTPAPGTPTSSPSGTPSGGPTTIPDTSGEVTDADDDCAYHPSS